MKFICLKEDLAKALEVAVKGVDAKPQNAQLAGVFLDVSGGYLTIETNNYKLGFKTSLPVDDQSAGQTVVDARKLFSIVKAVTGDSISFELDEHAELLDVVSGKIKYALKTIGEAADFPRVKEVECVTKINLAGELLSVLINRTAFACSKDETEYLFTGCLIETNDDTITFVGSNKHSLMYNKSLINKSADIRVIVPAESLKAVAPFIDGGKTAVIELDDKKAMLIRSGKFIFKLRLIDGNFADWERIIPKDNTTIIKVVTRDFIAALNRVLLISPYDNKIRIKKSEYGGLTLIAQNAATGIAEENVDADISGEVAGDYFNAKKLIDGIKALDSDTCTIYAKETSYCPVIIRNNDYSCYILAPMCP